MGSHLAATHAGAVVVGTCGHTSLAGLVGVSAFLSAGSSSIDRVVVVLCVTASFTCPVTPAGENEGNLHHNTSWLASHMSVGGRGGRNEPGRRSGLGNRERRAGGVDVG